MNKRKRKKEKTIRKAFQLFVFLVLVIAAPLIAEALDVLLAGIFLKGKFSFDFHYVRCMKLFFESPIRMKLYFVFVVLFVCSMVLHLYRIHPQMEEGEVAEVARGIWTPVPAGNGQFGTARFMTEKELDKEFSVAIHKGKNNVKGLSENAGIIVSYEKTRNEERIRYLTEAVNTIILGATRSGKTRRLLLTSTWLDLIAGVNLLVIDVKGENFVYTNKFAKEMGYEIRTLDFRYPEKSMHLNNLEEINQLLKNGEISQAVNKAWDIVTILVGEPQGERIWTDGQCATIVAAILIVSQDAPEACKNLTNVYYFLAYMCEPDPETGEMPITEYLNNLPTNHPARGAFQIAKIAPFRTRSSFFTSALATLRLYTDWNVADITSKSDYVFSDIDEKKVITYLILPDEKTTFHPIGAIFIKQLYESLVDAALRNGGELKRRFIFRADEIGNFPVIPGLGTMLSAGAGRNIFFELVLQDYQQTEGKYKNDFRNIKTNCQLTICLRVTDEQTTKNLSMQLGNYTIRTESVSSSLSDGGRTESASYSNNLNLTGRPLLYPDEIAALENPDALLLYGGKKAIVTLPDLSEYQANKIFGMGSKEENLKLYLARMEERPERKIGEPHLWGIWSEYGAEGSMPEEKISFL